MADEPTLQKGQSGEWVKYLQQVMAHYQFWNGVADGEFGDDLEAAVIRVQQTYGITADGVVRAATWAVLTGVPGDISGAWPARHGGSRKRAFGNLGRRVAGLQDVVHRSVNPQLRDPVRAYRGSYRGVGGL
jgi:hypothetical protein